MRTGGEGETDGGRSHPTSYHHFAVEDTLVEQVVETIEHKAKAVQIGDGKIFVYDIGKAVRIRTGETDMQAL